MKRDGEDTAYRQRVHILVGLALEEDLPGGDVTTDAVLDATARAEGVIVAREDLTVSGLDVAACVFQRVDDHLDWEAGTSNGDRVAAGAVLATVKGSARSILAGERTALNFLQHLSGIATLTARVLDRVAGSRVTILDTRKTLPGWRLLEKKAVRDGGGTSHRASLSESVLIKDNHIVLAGSPAAAVARARDRLPAGALIEVEVESLDEIGAVIRAGADIVLFDNADLPTLAEAARRAKDRGVPLEASGGIGIGEVAAVAATGVERISMGALTHSAPSVDISMDVRKA